MHLQEQNNISDEEKLDIGLENHIARHRKFWLAAQTFMEDSPCNDQGEISGVQSSSTLHAALCSWGVDTVPKAS